MAAPDASAGPTLSVQARLSQHSRGAFSLDVTLEAPPGITVLFGPSGAGKSTTLQCIAGMARPEDGRIALGNDVWFDAERGVDRAIHTRGVAYVFQSLALFPHLTAAQNAAYGVDRGVPAPRRRQRALEMLERMRVLHLADRKPRTFSGGEAQRVALARAFAMSPRVVLLDEAFSALDRELRRELAFDVRQFVDDVRIPVILVTHMRNEARALGDRVVMMHEGRVTGVGPVEEMLGAAGSGAAAAGAGMHRDRNYDEPELTPRPRAAP